MNVNPGGVNRSGADTSLLGRNDSQASSLLNSSGILNDASAIFGNDIAIPFGSQSEAAEVEVKNGQQTLPPP